MYRHSDNMEHMLYIYVRNIHKATLMTHFGDSRKLHESNFLCSLAS